MRACPAAGTAADTAADLAAGHALTLPISPLTPLSILAQHPPHPHHTHTTQLITSASTPPSTRQSTHTLNPIRDSLPSLGEISLQFGPATGPLPYRGSIGPGSSAGLLHAISLATGAPTAALTTDSAAISPAFTRGPITHPPMPHSHTDSHSVTHTHTHTQSRVSLHSLPPLESHQGPAKQPPPLSAPPCPPSIHSTSPNTGPQSRVDCGTKRLVVMSRCVFMSNMWGSDQVQTPNTTKPRRILVRHRPKLSSTASTATTALL